MFAQVMNGEVVSIINSPKSITIDEVTYPSNIFSTWSHDELFEIGILPYREVSVDNKYYWTGPVSYDITDSEVVGTYESISRSVAPLIEGMVVEARTHVSAILGRDDWMVSREFEGGDPMPENIKTFRSNIREESNAKELEIMALTDLVGIMAYRNCPYISIRKTTNVDPDTLAETWGPETEESEIHMDMVLHYESVDPLAKVDPSFVSLTWK